MPIGAVGIVEFVFFILFCHGASTGQGGDYRRCGVVRLRCSMLRRKAISHFGLLVAV